MNYINLFELRFALKQIYCDAGTLINCRSKRHVKDYCTIYPNQISIVQLVSNFFLVLNRGFHSSFDKRAFLLV